MKRITLLYLLSSWIGASSAQEIRNLNVPEGDDVLLPCGLDSQQRIDEFDWRKYNGEEEKMEVFEYTRGSHPGNGQNDQFKKRVEFFQHELKSGNASIIIKNTRLEDKGTYICGVGLRKPHRQEFDIRLNVGAAPLPHIQMIHDKITWKQLGCRVKGSPEPQVEWRNSAGHVLAKHIPNSGHSHVELQVKVTMSDIYTCVVTQGQIYHQINNTVEVNFPVVVAVLEGNDVILPCSFNSKHNIMRFNWSKDDKMIVIYDRGTLKEDDNFSGRMVYPTNFGAASIKLLNTKRADSGHFTCHLPNKQEIHIILHVLESGPVGAAAIFSKVISLVALSILIGMY